jgi:molybdate transport system substrate-binding protein
MRRLWLGIAAVLSLLLVLGVAVAMSLSMSLSTSTPVQAAGPLRVAAASSLASTLPLVGEAFTARSGQPVITAFEGTSRVVQQLRAGAPADVFFSADSEWMDHAVARGLVQPDTRTNMLGNSLVVVVPTNFPSAPADAAGLTRVTWRPLALANAPVPAGRYARQAFEAAGVWPALKGHVVGGANVRTVLAWVARGESPAGVVYATDAQAEPGVRVAFAVPSDQHDPIVYPAAVTSHAQDPAGAQAFLAFCKGPEAAAIFQAAGFAVVP